MSIDRKRLLALESRVGHKLPPDFKAALIDREPIREGSVAFVTPNRVWDVRNTFGLDSGDKSDQLDSVYELVGDVLPPGMLPFAEDLCGNFYCLILSGTHAGRVVFWDHERDEGDHRVKPVAESITEFYTSLVPDPREDDV